VSRQIGKDRFADALRILDVGCSSLAGLDNFAFFGLQLAGDFQRALLDIYRS